MTNPDQYESPTPTTPQEIADEIRRLLSRVEAMACEMCARPAPLKPSGFRDHLEKCHAMVSRHLDQLLEDQDDDKRSMTLIQDLPYDWERQLEQGIAEGITTARGPKQKINYLLKVAAIVQQIDDHFTLTSTPNSPPFVERGIS